VARPLTGFSGWLRCQAINVQRFVRIPDGRVKMQYKQALRIIVEIAQTPNVPIDVALAATGLSCRSKPLPKLGPYPKRSVAQVLWRLVSDSSCAPEARLKMLRKLLVLSSLSHRVLSECRSGPLADPEVKFP
jgi:hypothetical protein